MSLVVDLGQSGARLKFDEKITNVTIAKNSAETVVETLERIFQQLPPQTFDEVFLSLTGLQGKVDDPRAYGELCERFFAAKEVCVMDDGIASYAGAMRDRDGVVLTLGGGVVAISSHRGKFGHADGKGAIFGDLGGGFWVGQSAMRRAIATIDGRANSQELVSLLDEELKIYFDLHDKTGVEASSLCIRAAKSVARGAESGVADALAILNEGAEHLAHTVVAAWSKVKVDDDFLPAFSIQGGLSKSARYVELIKSHISSRMRFDYAQGLGDHLDGASLVAARYPDGMDPLLKWWRKAV